ncbi:stage V sporulation protein AD [Aureibacillus halotolerans]|uniref:Stage V sporulation protein AD n=1 Tax=Aureibacillus halotolerans TaxID=1508390 RepID=A0A4R6U641_9BACI|nr:stage V sporulation protein AD [Aureibacillus halotolerans]TDQ40323.1 stage V sporulation protein AD [Aureibacillus halotolerans]
MRQGQYTISFNHPPVIHSTGVAGGPFEARGNLVDAFDYLYEDLYIGESSFEKAQKKLLQTSFEIAIEKGGLVKEDIQHIVCGDLLNQITSSSFATLAMDRPYIGVFGACSTSIEALGLAAMFIDGGYADTVLTGTASHNAAVEKQFRYPTEYGGQKPPTAQWTVTGAGSAVLKSQGNGPRVTSVTFGRVVDMGLKDPFNMGGAMAPAAVDTIQRHLADTGRTPADYDLIVTGDLGQIGRATSLDLLRDQGLELMDETYVDCGLLMYSKDQKVQAGGSGCGCSAVGIYGHFINEMNQGRLQRILAVATGALLSPLSYQQKESIPCIAHAVTIERQGVQ